jgi:hypothetical protein
MSDGLASIGLPNPVRVMEVNSETRLAREEKLSAPKHLAIPKLRAGV